MKRISRWTAIVVTFWSLASCGGDELIDVSSRAGALYVGYKVYNVAIENNGETGCIVSTDGQATTKYIRMETCPTGWPVLGRKTWTMEAVEEIDDPTYWWSLKNTQSGYCVRYQSGDEYKEAPCDNDDYRYWFKFSDEVLNDANIIPYYSQSESLMPYRTYVVDESLSHTPVTDIEWNLYVLAP